MHSGSNVLHFCMFFLKSSLYSREMWFALRRLLWRKWEASKCESKYGLPVKITYATLWAVTILPHSSILIFITPYFQFMIPPCHTRHPGTPLSSWSTDLSSASHVQSNLLTCGDKNSVTAGTSRWQAQLTYRLEPSFINHYGGLCNISVKNTYPGNPKPCSWHRDLEYNYFPLSK